MKDYARAFYSSQAWKTTRAAYAKSKGHLCERCLAKGIYRPGEIVHHKVHLSPENLQDLSISLSWDNLQLVCRECHAELHDRKKSRYKFDNCGRVVLLE
ncbi:MAG: HNH endonuclease [Bacteroidales bacterium]|nr:HNH endonuclease [Bacteroidales bacterium]